MSRAEGERSGKIRILPSVSNTFHPFSLSLVGVEQSHSHPGSGAAPHLHHLAGLECTSFKQPRQAGKPPERLIPPLSLGFFFLCIVRLPNSKSKEMKISKFEKVSVVMRSSCDGPTGHDGLQNVSSGIVCSLSALWLIVCLPPSTPRTLQAPTSV